MARPTALTPEVRQQVERELADDAPVVVVAQNAGVSPRTIHSWLQTGRVVRRRRPSPLDVPVTPVPEAEPTVDGKLVAAEPALAAAKRGSWQAAWRCLRGASRRGGRGRPVPGWSSRRRLPKRRRPALAELVHRRGFERASDVLIRWAS